MGGDAGRVTLDVRGEVKMDGISGKAQRGEVDATGRAPVKRGGYACHVNERRTIDMPVG